MKIQAFTCASVALVALTFAHAGVADFKPSPMGMENLSIDGSRPLAAALLELERRHGVVLSYEDPRYLFQGDTKDVTNEVRKDLDSYPPGASPKVLIPRPSRIDIQYEVLPTGEIANLEKVIHALLERHDSNGNPGSFRLEILDDRMVVVPSAVLDASGTWQSTGSVLDVVIDLPEAERNIADTLEAICSELARLTGVEITMGTVPTNLFFQERARIGASGEMARDVLIRLLQQVPGRRFAWRLLHDPGLDWQALNVREIRRPE